LLKAAFQAERGRLACASPARDSNIKESPNFFAGFDKEQKLVDSMNAAFHGSDGNVASLLNANQ